MDAALAELKAAEEILSVNRVDEAALEPIEALHLAVELGRSRAEARRPLVRVEALTGLNGAIDGTPFRLAADEQLERRVEETLSLTVPEVLTLTVVGGVDGDPRPLSWRPRNSD